MDFRKLFVNASLTALPKPFQWARRLALRQSLDVDAPQEKSTPTPSPARDASSKSTLPRQDSNTGLLDRMVKAEDDASLQARRGPENTVWRMAWLVFLLSIIPVVVLTLSFLAVAGCTSTSPGIPSIYLYNLDIISSGTSLRIGYAGICAVRADGPTRCTMTNAWSKPRDVSVALFQSSQNSRADPALIPIQPRQTSDHVGAPILLGEEHYAFTKVDPPPPTSIASNYYQPSSSPADPTVVIGSDFFSSTPTSTEPMSTLAPIFQPSQSASSTASPFEPTSGVTATPVPTASSTTPFHISPTTPPLSLPSSDTGPHREDPPQPLPSPNFGLGFDPVQATALALAYQRAEPPFCVFTVVFFILALVQFALLRALPHHFPCLRPFVTRNKCGIRVVAWVSMLVALLMGGLGTQWACWYASRAGLTVEVDINTIERGHAVRDVERIYQLRYGGSRALLLLQLFAEIAMLLPVVCVLITTVEGWVLKRKGGCGNLEKMRASERSSGQEMDQLGLSEEGRSPDRREAEGRNGLENRHSSDSESSRGLPLPQRPTGTLSVISISLSDTHSHENASTPAPAKPAQPVPAVLHDSTTPDRIHSDWTAPTNSVRFSTSQYGDSDFGSVEGTHWCAAAPVQVTKGARLVDITSTRKRGGGRDRGGQNWDDIAGHGSEE